MKISVIIPAYNEEKYIGTCLESLMNQEVKADEIIVVNNNSTDLTEKIARSFPVRVLLETKQGMIPARNRGFDEAKYEIIARTDADAVCDPSWIKEVLSYYKSHLDVDCFSGAAYYDGVPDNVNFHLLKNYIESFKAILGYYPLLGPNMSLRRSMWNKVRENICMDDSLVHEDIDLAIHICEDGGTLGFQPTAITHSSTRRITSNPHSFFLEYPHRMIKTLKHHNVSIQTITKLQVDHLKKSSQALEPFRSKVKKFIRKTNPRSIVK